MGDLGPGNVNSSAPFQVDIGWQFLDGLDSWLGLISKKRHSSPLSLFLPRRGSTGLVSPLFFLRERERDFPWVYVPQSFWFHCHWIFRSAWELAFPHAPVKRSLCLCGDRRPALSLFKHLSGLFKASLQEIQVN